MRAACLALFGALALLSLPIQADPDNPEPLSAFPQSLLAIRTARGSVLDFLIWTADTPAREEQGLMYVKELDEHAGMLFMFPKNQRVSMWMKNTYIPLDMLFLDATGRIDHIVERAAPLSTSIIASPNPERAVIELKGGAVQALGIHVGDQALHRRFGPGK